MKLHRLVQYIIEMLILATLYVRVLATGKHVICACEICAPLGYLLS